MFDEKFSEGGDHDFLSLSSIAVEKRKLGQAKSGK